MKNVFKTHRDPDMETSCRIIFVGFVGFHLLLIIGVWIASRLGYLPLNS